MELLRRAVLSSDDGEDIVVISVWIEHVGGVWFGVAHHGDSLVATATGVNREDTARRVCASLARGVSHQVVEEGSEYARRVLHLLARLEAGEERVPSFELCSDCIGEPLASVAHVSSAIPRGFVATYGDIAMAAGTDARVVGHIMATNPLYPIIPCHRVVGADLSLVGYTGSRDALALLAKLTRLRAEASGFTDARTVLSPHRPAGLLVYPVERAIAKATADGLGDRGQLSLW